MTGPGMNPPSGADRNKRVDVGGADAVPDTPHTAKAQGAEPGIPERRKTPRGPTAPATAVGGGGVKPIVWIVVAIVVIAAIVFGMGLV